MSRRTALLLLFLFSIALLPRLLFLAEEARSPLFERPYLDAKSYDTWGLELASGRWVGERPFHMAPLYPYLLGVFYRVAGHNTLLLRLLQHMIGAGSALLLFLVARRLFGGRVGLIAFLLGLGYGPFLYFEGQILASFLGIAFGLLALHLLLRAIERDGRGLLAAGLALGIGSAARPNLLFFAPFALGWILVHCARSRRGAVLYAAGFLAALIPTAAHNYAVSGELIPISSHGGVSFYLGNNTYTRGTYVPPPEFAGTPESIDIYDSRRVAEEETGRRLSASEVSRYWYGRSFDFLRANPRRAAALFGRKIVLYVNAFEIPLGYNYEFDRRLFRVLRAAPFSFGILLSLAVAGAFLIVRERRRGTILLLFVLANALSVVAFFVCARYRQTAVPAIAIAAAFAVDRMAEALLARRWRRFASIGGVALAAALPVHAPVYPGVATSEARSACILGSAYGAAGMAHEAEDAFRHALSVVPDHVDAWMNLGLLYYRNGRFREAAEAFGEATRRAPRFAGAWSNRGNALRETGEIDAALRAIGEAVRLDTAYAGGFHNLGYTLARAGRAAEAEAAYRRAIRLDPRSVDSWANLADLQVERGDLAGAGETMRAASKECEKGPAARWKGEKIARAAKAYREAARAAAAGRYDETARALAEAVREGGEPFRRWAARDPVLERFRESAPPGREAP